MFAAFDFNVAKFAQLIVNVLAVGGGFLVGYILTAAVGKAIDRFVIHRTSPPGLHKACRIIGGILLAILVGMLVFGHGRGWNLMGGAADGDGDGESTGTPVPAKPTASEQSISTTPPLVKKLGPTVRVTVLGGADVKEEKFYLIDDDTTPRTLAALKDELRRKKEATAEKLTMEIRIATTNTLSREHQAVKQLQSMAGDSLGLNVTYVAEGF